MVGMGFLCGIRFGLADVRMAYTLYMFSQPNRMNIDSKTAFSLPESDSNYSEDVVLLALVAGLGVAGAACLVPPPPPDTVISSLILL